MEGKQQPPHEKLESPSDQEMQEEQRLRTLFGSPSIVPPWTVTRPAGAASSREMELEATLRERESELQELQRLVVRLQDLVLGDSPGPDSLARLGSVMAHTPSARALDVSSLSSFSAPPLRAFVREEAMMAPSEQEVVGAQESLLPSSLLSQSPPIIQQGAPLGPMIAAQRAGRSKSPPKIVIPLSAPSAGVPTPHPSKKPATAPSTPLTSLLPTPSPPGGGLLPLSPTAPPFIAKRIPPSPQLISMSPPIMPSPPLGIFGYPSPPTTPLTAPLIVRARGDSDASSEGATGPTAPALLSEMRGQLYALTKYQAGCRFLQRQLDEHGTPESIALVFNEVFEHLPDMMVDPYGQYLVPKLMQHGNPMQRQAIVNKLLPDLVRFACNQYGSHGSQKMLVFLTPAQVQQVTEVIRPRMMELFRDVKGNYFVQAFLKTFPSERNEFIYDFICSNLMEVCGHKVGCTVVSKAVDTASPQQLERLASEVIARALVLMQDQYGNYVVQHMLTDAQTIAPQLIKSALGHIAFLSTQKFSSNVIEKCLQVADEEHFEAMLHEIMDEASLPGLLQDQYGNFVVQTALDTSTGEQHTQLVQRILPHIHDVQSPYAMHIQKKLLRV